jgi:hypothetical protein
MYLFGAGTTKDVSRAIEIYKGLAAKGNDRAAMILGEIYESDKYVKQDLPRAFAWYGAEYEARPNPEVKSRVDFLKPFLTADQIAEADKIKSAILVTNNQFSKVN